MGKLTLSVDDRIVERAKVYAAKRGTSVSQLVETYLDTLARPAPVVDAELPQSLRRLRGILKGVSFDREDYLDYLERKYR
jgi:hypothetical protein